jgi:hypothetical protein
VVTGCDAPAQNGAAVWRTPLWHRLLAAAWLLLAVMAAGIGWSAGGVGRLASGGLVLCRRRSRLLAWNEVQRFAGELGWIAYLRDGTTHVRADVFAPSDLPLTGQLANLPGEAAWACQQALREHRRPADGNDQGRWQPAALTDALSRDEVTPAHAVRGHRELVSSNT